MKLNLLLLLILAGTKQSGKEIDAAFYNCEFLVEAGSPFELMCSGIYSSELRLKYRDKWVKADAPYRIWARSSSTDLRQLFISFYESPISNCANITCHLSWLHCQDSEMFGVILQPKEVHCFRKTFAYVKDLQRTCNGSVFDSLDYVAIHYARLVRSDAYSSGVRSARQCRVLRLL
ncbi:hypothetical protein KR222_006971, partial [Zaprionus bogoriensis]